MERLTHYNYTDASGFILSVDDQEKANIELARYENLGIEAGELAWILDDYKAMKDAEEQGRLIVFPVAIGDHVWCFPSKTEHYREMQVIGLSCDFGARYVQVQDVVTCETVYFNAENMGRTMFTTREQAEAKLKEMEADNAENHQTE